MVSRAIQNAFSKGFIGVHEDDTLSGCISLFKEKMPPVLVVLDSEGKYAGVISGRSADFDTRPDSECSPFYYQFS